MKKLSDAEVQYIRELYANGASQSQLARDYLVSRATIQNYLNGYLYNTLRKNIANLTPAEWRTVSKRNVQKLSSRSDAPVYYDCMKDL